MNNSKHLGFVTEMQCMTYLLELGYDISTPLGDNCRYDFIIDVNDKLYRIQCKTAHKEGEGVYSFQCRNVGYNSKGSYVKPYTKEEIDFFSTFIEGKCYLIPIEHTGSRTKTLRFVPPKNNQTKGITFAEDYIAEKQLSLL